MKKIVFFLAMLFLFPFNVYSAMVSFAPPTHSANVGDIFLIDIVGAGFNKIVDGGGINLNFNPSILNVNKVTLNTSWNFFKDTGTIDNITGKVQGIRFIALPSSITGDFNIGSIEFFAVGQGTSNLSLAEDAANPFAGGGSLLNPNFTNGSVTVSAIPVPEPATLILISSGFLWILFFRGKRVRAE